MSSEDKHSDKVNSPNFTPLAQTPTDGAINFALGEDGFVPIDGDPKTVKGWKFLLERGQDYDKQQLERWNDEMANLLVFAGLFSAVVTAFTVESVDWLQEDPADTSAKILAQISAQLSSFAISQSFVNSTAVISSVSDASRPNQTYETINMLWILSLTLSLLAAFFAIAVQQWLRAFPLPQHLSIEDSLFLRQRRNKSLIVWQVPNIIALLPVMLQAAVVMFLVGLYLLLKIRSHSIMLVFVAICGVSFFLYAVSLFLPLIWRTCPYKSPLLPTAVFLMHLCSIVLSVLSLAVLGPLCLLTWICGGIYSLYRRGKSSDLDQKVFRVGLRVIEGTLRLVSTARNSIISMLYQSTDFWTSREIRYFWQSGRPKDLGGALAWAPQIMRRDELAQLQACFISLGVKQRARAILRWIVSYSGSFRKADYQQYNLWSPINGELVDRVSERFTQRYLTYLLDALPQDSELRQADWLRKADNISSILIILTQAALRTNHDRPTIKESLRTSIVQALVRIFNRMHNPYECYDGMGFTLMRYSTECLFRCAQEASHEFAQVVEVESLVSSTIGRIERLQTLYRFNWKEYMVDVPELVLGSAAIALLALPHSTSEQGKGHELLQVLGAFVDDDKRSIRSMGKIAESHKDEKYIMVQRAMDSISKSLWEFSENNHLPSDSVAKLSKKLLDLCEGQPAFSSAAATLRGIRTSRPPMRTFDRSKEQASAGGSISPDQYFRQRDTTLTEDTPMSGSTVAGSPPLAHENMRTSIISVDERS